MVLNENMIVRNSNIDANILGIFSICETGRLCKISYPTYINNAYIHTVLGVPNVISVSLKG